MGDLRNPALILGIERDCSKGPFTTRAKGQAFSTATIEFVTSTQSKPRVPLAKKLPHQCFPGPDSGLKQSAVPERLAMAHANAMVTVRVNGNPLSAMYMR